MPPDYAHIRTAFDSEHPHKIVITQRKDRVQSNILQLLGSAVTLKNRIAITERNALRLSFETTGSAQVDNNLSMLLFLGNLRPVECVSALANHEL